MGAAILMPVSRASPRNREADGTLDVALAGTDRHLHTKRIDARWPGVTGEPACSARRDGSANIRRLAPGA